MRLLIPVLLLALAGCGQDGRHARAKALIAERCGACHIVPGVRGTAGRVGPSLDGIGRQQVIAGFFANSRPNMIRWISHPQAMLPGNAMPDTGLGPAEAAAIADYLYTLD
jgi:cytochrome c